MMPEFIQISAMGRPGVDRARITRGRIASGLGPIAAIALCLSLSISFGSAADAQPKKGVITDPCDPAYVPKRGENPPVCPGSRVLQLEPMPKQARGLATPPSVETPRAKGPAGQGRIVVNAPAFQMLRDGSSKVYVEIHGVPAVKQVITRGGVTYVMTDCRVPVANNRHALLTNHFNTPVSDARLSQNRGDVLLRIDLRTPVEPMARLFELVPGKAVLLEVTFPPGSYVTEPIADPERGTRGNGSRGGKRSGASDANHRRGGGGGRSSGGGYGPPAP